MSREVSYLMDGNKTGRLPDRRKEMQRPGKIENVKNKIHAGTRKSLLHGVSDSV